MIYPQRISYEQQRHQGVTAVGGTRMFSSRKDGMFGWSVLELVIVEVVAVESSELLTVGSALTDGTNSSPGAVVCCELEADEFCWRAHLLAARRWLPVRRLFFVGLAILSAVKILGTGTE